MTIKIDQFGKTNIRVNYGQAKTTLKALENYQQIFQEQTATVGDILDLNSVYVQLEEFVKEVESGKSETYPYL